MDAQKNIDRTENEWNLLFNSLYKQYFKKLCVFGTTILNDDEEAEEIVQRVMFKLWEQRQNYDNIGNVSSYLFRSVKNHCLNTIAHRKIEDKYKSEAWTELKALESNVFENNDDVKARKEESLRRAIETLPDRCHEVLVLSKFEGLKNKEIAERLNISVKAVEANITRAFAHIRKILHNKIITSHSNSTD